MLAGGGLITDTTGSAAFAPVVVTAVLAAPVAGLASAPCHLDGPASFGALLAWQDGHGLASLPAIGDAPADFALPLAMWTAPAPDGAHPSALTAAGLAWGWACSRALYDDGGRQVLRVRKKPATDAAARYCAAARWDIGAGPLKARDTPRDTVLTRQVTWHALADRDALAALLARVHGIGALTRQGNGTVLSWQVVPGGSRDAWRDRVMPQAGGLPAGIRAPYWHPSRRMPCTR